MQKSTQHEINVCYIVIKMVQGRTNIYKQTKGQAYKYNNKKKDLIGRSAFHLFHTGHFFYISIKKNLLLIQCPGQKK